MSSEQEAALGPAEPSSAPPERPAGRRRWIPLRILLPLVIVLDVLAYLVVPPFDTADRSAACAFPLCFINGNLEFPVPHVVLDLDAAHPLASGGLVIGFHPSITSTILTLWIVSILLVVALALVGRRRELVPGRVQNAFEFAYEAMTDFATSIGGPEARRYVPYFAALLIYLLFCNWSGLIPPVGKLEELRAPTSDVNITIGLALLSFLVFEYQGFRKLGVRRYLGKFFPLGEFRHGLGAGLLGLLVGIIEFFLDLVRPVTLSMRLFGNIYGGEVALGVVTGLTVSLLPVAIISLEFLLNFIQALIFSVLSLMYILLAIEYHGHDEELAVEGAEAFEGALHVNGAQPAPAP